MGRQHRQRMVQHPKLRRLLGQGTPMMTEGLESTKLRSELQARKRRTWKSPEPEQWEGVQRPALTANRKITDGI